MKIIDFTHGYITEANALAIVNYEEEQNHVPALPYINSIPDLSEFADNGLGVAAFDNDKMVGFLCCYKPFDNAFGISGVRGVFSPMGGNAAVPENRAKIYAAMYQAAGEKWARAGAVSHAVCLYAHDKKAQEQFFRYGFGLRCVDAIRGMEEIAAPVCEGYIFEEIVAEEHISVYSFVEIFNRPFLASPTFMVRPFLTETAFLDGVRSDRFFTAKKDGVIVAFVSISNAGETFICNTPKYIHADGAFCLPEHRGKGVMQGLLSYTVNTLKTDGYTEAGTDFESINPAACGFWLKYFTAYTHSVVRRIDDNILKVTKLFLEDEK